MQYRRSGNVHFPPSLATKRTNIENKPQIFEGPIIFFLRHFLAGEVRERGWRSSRCKKADWPVRLATVAPATRDFANPTTRLWLAHDVAQCSSEYCSTCQ